MKFIMTISAAIIVATIAPAKASYMTGNELLEECTGNVGKQMSCLGYIEGVSDSLDLGRANNSRSGCVADGVTAGQLQDVVIRYLRNNPEKRNFDASVLTVIALGEAWNCKSKP